MKTLSGLLLVPLVVLGLIVVPLGNADAAEPKKKPVTTKQTVKKTAKKPVKRVAAKPAQPRPLPLARKVAAAAPLMAAGSAEAAGDPEIKSSAVVVIDQSTGDILYEKNANTVVPIASITKLMTAMVTLDARASLSESIEVTREDIDTLKGTRSRLAVGTQLTREEMLRLALMSSENRAAAALSRHYPGGRPAFIAAMNAKARELGLHHTRFTDATGLSPANVASARDLVYLVDAAHRYPLIREFSTSEEYHVAVRGRSQTFRNTNVLVKNDNWQIGLSKTGYINEAGKCLVMQAWFDNKPTIIVLLDSWGKLTRIGDANRIRHWIESAASQGDALSS